jgi:hypothetical protein
LGINVAPGADPAALRAAGAMWVRCVYRERSSLDLRPWISKLLDHGIQTVLVGDSSPNSLGKAANQWESRMIAARDHLGNLVKCWQWFNEPDGTGMASWTMSHADLNPGLEIARRVFPPGKGWFLIGPGLVSGNAAWLDGMRLDLLDAIDVHPYAKYISTQRERDALNGMLDAYINRIDGTALEFWLGEYDSRTRGLSAYLRDFRWVSRAAVMCWDSGMTAGEGLNLGLLQNPAAMADFKSAAANQGGPPQEHHAEFILGFAKWAAIEPGLLGEPLINERNVRPGWQTQPTENGVLSWVEGKGHSFVTHEGRVFRWQEDWRASQEVPA